MSQEKKNKSVGDILNNVQRYINNSPDYDKKKKLVEEVKLLKKQYTAFFRFTMILLVFSILTTGFILFLSFKLEDVSFEKENLEMKLTKTKFDSLVEKLLEFKKELAEDSTEVDAITYRIDSLGNPKSYWTIVKEKDSISKMLISTKAKAEIYDQIKPKYRKSINNNLADSLKLSLLKENLGIEFEVKETKNNIQVRFKGKRIDSVRSGYLFLRGNLYLDTLEKRWLIDPTRYLED